MNKINVMNECMMNFNFIAGNRFELDDFKDINKFIDIYPDFQTVTLGGENELQLLLELIGIDEFRYHELVDSEFSRYWDLSAFKLPEFNEEQFDRFYQDWIDRSHRNNSMDEYGSLIFLQGLSLKWNKLNYRLILQEK